MARFTLPPADEVRARLLRAARDEFAASGLVGGRIERIAAASGSNKAQLFHYFGGKEGLFDAVLAQELDGMLDEVPFDAEDLPGYAGRLHDAALQRPWVERLTTWRRLERTSSEPIEVLARAAADTVAEVERAQRAGVLPRTMRPAVLLALVLHLATTWQATSPEFDPLVAAVTPARRRQTVVDAVAALLAGSVRAPR